MFAGRKMKQLDLLRVAITDRENTAGSTEDGFVAGKRSKLDETATVWLQQTEGIGADQKPACDAFTSEGIFWETGWRPKEPTRAGPASIGSRTS